MNFLPTKQPTIRYGTVPSIPGFGGLAPVEQSAQQLADFADNVMARMNASQVDLVGKIRFDVKCSTKKNPTKGRFTD